MNEERLIRSLIERNIVADPSLTIGIAKYVAIQTEFQKTKDVRLAPAFQKNFRAFYRVRRNPEWQRTFFELMQQRRVTPPTF